MAGTRHLIVDGRPGHYFLYALYARLADSQLAVFDDDIRCDFGEPLRCLRPLITRDLRAILFVTAEELIYGPSKGAFVTFLKDTGGRCAGIVHRAPRDAGQAEALRAAARHMKAVIVLAPEFGEYLSRTYQLRNVEYLPHHAPFADHLPPDPQAIRDKIGASRDLTVFSVMGEARRGKGIELLLAALEYVPADDLNKMFFLFGGRDRLRGTDVAGALARLGAHGFVDLRQSDDPLKYNVLSDREFADYVGATDIGLLLYQHEQRTCMSGVAPNYVFAGKQIVATADSVIGRLVRRHGLGTVLVEETPQALAAALVAAMRSHAQGWRPPDAYMRFRADLSPDNVLARLGEILDREQAAPTLWRRLRGFWSAPAAAVT